MKKLASEFFMDRKNKKLFESKQRGRQAEPHQIEMAKELARKLGKAEPEQFYSHHLSLAKWIYDNRKGLKKGL